MARRRGAPGPFETLDVSIHTRNVLVLHREMQLVAENWGCEEFVVVDRISLKEEKFVFVLEAKRPSPAQLLKQCLLVTKDVAEKQWWGSGIWVHYCLGHLEDDGIRQ